MLSHGGKGIRVVLRESTQKPGGASEERWGVSALSGCLGDSGCVGGVTGIEREFGGRCAGVCCLYRGAHPHTCGGAVHSPVSCCWPGGLGKPSAYGGLGKPRAYGGLGKPRAFGGLGKNSESNDSQGLKPASQDPCTVCAELYCSWPLRRISDQDN